MPMKRTFMPPHQLRSICYSRVRLTLRKLTVRNWAVMATAKKEAMATVVKTEPSSEEDPDILVLEPKKEIKKEPLDLDPRYILPSSSQETMGSAGRRWTPSPSPAARPPSRPPWLAWVSKEGAGAHGSLWVGC